MAAGHLLAHEKDPRTFESLGSGGMDPTADLGAFPPWRRVARMVREERPRHVPQQVEAFISHWPIKRYLPC